MRRKCQEEFKGISDGGNASIPMDYIIPVQANQPGPGQVSM